MASQPGRTYIERRAQSPLDQLQDGDLIYVVRPGQGEVPDADFIGTAADIKAAAAPALALKADLEAFQAAESRAQLARYAQHLTLSQSVV